MKKKLHPDEPVPTFPMRLNKYLAYTGVATRRDADVLIEKGLVKVNEQRATLGMKVEKDDVVEVTAKKKHVSKRIYVAFNKPRGVITHSPQLGEDDVATSLPSEFKSLDLFPVGRLDKDSHGLIILTNDGRITDRLLNPNAAHEKEYVVRTKLPLRNSFKEHMESGVDIEGYQTKPAKIKVNGDNSFTIRITEGKKHQIRRMVVAMHNEVVELKRTRVLNIKLGKLKAGEARYIEGDELTEFLDSLSLSA